jgi:MoaA/NifB/PqqE/SkfB family radical SAM enzyme
MERDAAGVSKPGKNIGRKTMNERGCVSDMAAIKESIGEAEMLVSKGRFQDAISLFKGLLATYPDLKDLYSILCDLYLRTGRTDMPRQWIINAVKNDQSFNRTFVDAASALYTENKFQEAIDMLSAVAEACPANAEAWNDLGVVQLSLGGHAVAEQSFKHALAVNRHYAEAITNLTILYTSTGRNELAKNTARLLLEKECTASADTFRTIGDILSREMPDEAERYYGVAGKASPVNITGGNGNNGAKDSPGDKKREFAPDLNNKAVVWYCTMKCNNRCPYCLAFQVNDPMIDVPFRDYRDWVDAWNKFEGNLILDITGGEPFLMPNFIEMLESFNKNIRIAMTTNTKCDLTHFVQRIAPERVISITCSLHPSQSMNIEYFLGKILLLKNRGFHVSVNYVAYPEQLWLIPHFKKMIESLGIRFHIDPYGPGPKRPYALSQKEQDFLKQFVGMDRGDFFNTQPVSYKCSGGMNFFSVLPNGDTYTCVTKRYVKDNYVGNLFDKNFKPFDKPIHCQAISCAGCDVDKVARVKLGK